MKKIIFILTFFMALSAFAQDKNLGKHPRVIEIEMMLENEAAKFMQRRHPGSAFTINVEVTPLRRTQNSTELDRLPYYNYMSEGELVDEWDSPDFTLETLIGRIQQAKVKLDVPDYYNDKEINYLRESILLSMKLVPGRDMVLVDRVSFSEKPEVVDYQIYIVSCSMIVLLLGCLYLMLNHFSKTNPKGSDNIAATSAGSNLQPRSDVASSFSSNQEPAGKSSDVNFRDPTKTIEIVKVKIKELTSQGHFPTLGDMIILEDLSLKSPHAFGALMYEFPVNFQETIFQRGRDLSWYVAFTQPTSIGNDCLVTLDRMLRSRNNQVDIRWEELLIQCWRIKDDLSSFIKTIPQDHALQILSCMPKNIAVPVSKKSFPGSWAKILDSSEKKKINDEKLVANYYEKIMTVKSYNKVSEIEKYRDDLDLLSYLRIASLRDEEEVYESLSPESNIFKLREPFYKIFKDESCGVEEIFNLFSLDNWALATINAPREYIKIIFNQLDDKKKFIFSSLLKNYDEGSVHIEAQTEIKEKMAKLFAQKSKIKKNSVSSLDSKKNDLVGKVGDDDALKAA